MPKLEVETIVSSNGLSMVPLAMATTASCAPTHLLVIFHAGVSCIAVRTITGR